MEHMVARVHTDTQYRDGNKCQKLFECDYKTYAAA